MANGIPAVEDFNNLDENVGVAPFPVNIDGAPGSTAPSFTSTLSVTGSSWPAMPLSSGWLSAAAALSAWPCGMAGG